MVTKNNKNPNENRIFAQYPKTYHHGYKVTDFTRRSQFFDAVRNDDTMAGDYYIREGETPTSLAQDFYGDPYLFWVIMYLNNIIDPFFDWPMDYDALMRHTEKKYPLNPDAVHYFEYQNQRYYRDEPAQMDALLELFPSAGGDPNKLSSMPLVNTVTRRMHEGNLNDSKRNIRILRPERLPKMLNQFRNSMKQKTLNPRYR